MPGNVSVVSSPVDGSVTARRETVIHADGENVGSTCTSTSNGAGGTGARFGQGDVRRLGAQLRFTYPG